MEYRDFFKSLLKESPDVVYFENSTLEWDIEGVSTMLIYPDSLENKPVTISFQYTSGGNFTDVWSDSQTVETEVRAIMKKDYTNPIFNTILTRINSNMSLQTQVPMEGLLSRIGWKITFGKYSITHGNISECLSLLERLPVSMNSSTDRGDYPAASRLFKHENKFVLSFWQNKAKLRSVKDKIVNYLHAIHIDPEQIYYQSIDMESDETLPMDRFFTLPTNKLSDVQRKEREIAQQLHVNKALLDKAILDALSSKPKNINDLYAALEDQLRMPIAKVRHLFKDFPFDKILARKVKEYVMEMKKLNFKK
jgi:hypothetical protein